MSAILQVRDHVTLIVMSAQRQQASRDTDGQTSYATQSLHLLFKNTHPGKTGVFSISAQWRSRLPGWSDRDDESGCANYTDTSKVSKSTGAMQTLC